MSIQEKFDLAENNLEWLLDWIGRFDNKSSVILGLNIGMLGVLASFAPPLHLLTPVMTASTVLSLLALGLTVRALLDEAHHRLSLMSLRTMMEIIKINKTTTISVVPTPNG